jgi:hypothetical protein
VVRSNADPNSLLDISGTNNEIGTQCSTSNGAAAKCQCVFNWTESSGVLRQSAPVDPIYVENNLLRCSFLTPASSSAIYFDVKILIANSGGLTSNALRVYLNTINPSLDTSIASNYSQVQRFMCRDLPSKSTNTNYYSGLFDPRLWNLSYAFNFYSTSLGRDYGAIPVSGGNTSLYFECPTIPNDQSDNPAYNYVINSIDGIDITNPSLSGLPAGTGDNTIYPPTDNNNIGRSSVVCSTGKESTCEQFKINRHDFYLAQFKGGPFKQPQCLFHTVANRRATQLNCDDSSPSGPPVVGNFGTAGSDIVGYAAMPDQNEECPNPSAVSIPSGKKWAKLWRFSASLPQRSISDITNPSNIGDLFCTTRKKECWSAKTAWPATSNSVCYNAGTFTGRASSTTDIGPTQSAHLGSPTAPGFGNCSSTGTVGDGRGDNADGTYSNFAAGGACLDGTTGENCCLDHGDTADAINRPANWTPGGDWCNSSLIGSHDASSATVAPNHAGSTVGGLAQDIWLRGTGTFLACIEADTDASGNLDSQFQSFPPTNPNPFILGTKVIDSSPMMDMIYVVTPPSVKVADMQDPENNKVARQYTPLRSIDNGGTPYVVKYGLDSNSLSTSNPADRLSLFPVCVLQDAVSQGSGP